jgi:hypothetical protein
MFFLKPGLPKLNSDIICYLLFQTELGGKLVPSSVLSTPPLTFRYGYSFLLLIISFLLSELSGTMAIFLFIEMVVNKKDLQQQQVTFDVLLN